MSDQALPAAIRPSTAPAPLVQLAIKAWNTMGGLDWAALPLVAELHGVQDLDTLVTLLVAIRDDHAANQD